MANGTESGRRVARNARRFPAGGHDCPRAEIFLFVETELLDFGTVEPHGYERICRVSNDSTSGHRLDDVLSG